MKLAAIFRYEVAYQARGAWYWLIFAALFLVAFLLTRDGNLAEALLEDFFVNSPFALAKVTVVGGLLWLVAAAAVAGEAAARDVASGMHSLAYAVPVSKAEYLGGRLLAALVLNALLLLAVPAGALVAVHGPGMDPAAVGPFRLAAYLNNYAFLALPNAFFVTAIQFLLAVRGGRPMAAYVGSFLLVLTGFFVASMLLFNSGLGRLLDPIGVRFVLEDLSHLWTSYEKSWRLLTLEGVILRNRLLWLMVGVGALALAWAGFRFEHRGEQSGWSRRRRSLLARPAARTAASNAAAEEKPGVPGAPPVGTPAVWPPLAVQPASRMPPVYGAAEAAGPSPAARRSFGPAVELRKMMAIAWISFRTLATSWAGVGMLAAVPVLSVLVVGDQMSALGAPLLPTTILVIRELTGPLSDELSRWIFVPFLIVFFAGELVWRERDAGMDEVADTLPGSEWTRLLGKLLGLGLLLGLFMALIMGAGIVAQLALGYPEPDLALYVKALFGLQLTEYLLFVPLALAAHALADHKYVGHLTGMMAYTVIVLAPMFGIEHKVAVYGAAPPWSWTHLRGFGPSLGPWLWFKLYWGAWALLLAVAARLFWVRGRETGLPARLREARRRLAGPTRTVAGVAVALVLCLGAFVFYNTNVLNVYRSAADVAALRAEYERRYGPFRDAPQPRVATAELRVDVHPEERAVAIRGSLRLVNETGAAIDSLHLTVPPGPETGPLELDRAAKPLPVDERLPHRIYVLEDPLQPGESMRLSFETRLHPRGFGEDGIDPSVAEDATHLDVGTLVPAIGYQPERELTNPGDRRAHGLDSRPVVPALEDVEVRWVRGEGAALNVVVGTVDDQVAVAPGALRRSWVDGGRRYFHYVTDGPIGSEWTVASAAYDVRQLRWDDPAGAGEGVDVRIYHHPDHTAHLDRMVHGIRASLDYYSREFAPYPYGHLTFVEVPAIGTGMHAAASLVTFTEGNAFWDLDDDAGSLDFPFAVVAHEVAHQWTLPSAFVEGAPVMSEGLAWYYAMRVVEETYGHQLHRLLRFMRQPYPYPPIRRGEPLLRGLDPYMAYRKGPFALHALSEYLGDAAVNRALRGLLGRHDTAGAPLATTLDLYRELQAVTPDSLGYLLHDLFEVNAFWELEAQEATAERTASGAWEVSLKVRARKVVADSTGAETEVPMDEWIELGVFGRPAVGEPELGAPLHVGKHRIRSGEQIVTVTVTGEPFLAGVDPYHVLDWVEHGDDDNIVPVTQSPAPQRVVSPSGPDAL